MEGLGGFLAYVAGAEKQDARRGEVAEDLQGEVHRDVGDADLALVDGGVGADVLRVLEGFLENAVEHGAGGAASLGGGVGILHLAEDFRLA